MKIFEMKFLIALGAVLALGISGCASGGSQKQVQQFDKPPSTVPETDKKLFLKALKAQKVGQYEASIQLWKDYLVKNPNSHEGHNNLGLVYYTQDMISQALQEFETAYRLEPVDLGIRRNLARGLRFRANMFHENREYFKTLDILARLEGIVPEDDQQGVLMKMEQVEDQIFLQVIKADNVSAYLDFVQRFPDGLNAVRAQEYLGKHSSQVSRAQKKNRKSRQSGMIQSVESGSFTSGGSTQAPPDYGSPTYYGSSQPSATYSPPSSKPGRVARKEKFDIFGVVPSAGESITEENFAASQGAAETLVIIPSENFTKPGRIDGKSGDSATGKQRVGEDDPPIRAQPEVLADGPDTHPDLEAPQMAAADTESTDIKLEPAGQEEAPPAESTAPEVKLSTIEQAIKEAEAEMAPAANAEPAEPMMAEQEKTEAPSAESTTPEVEQSAIEQAIKEAEAELAQAQTTSVESSLKEILVNESAAADPGVEEKAEPETSAAPPMAVASLNKETGTAQPETAKEKGAPVSSSEPAPAATKTLDPESVSQTVASLIPSKPGDIKDTRADSQTFSNAVVVIQVRQGSTLNVRAEPSASGEILGYLENGDMMPFTKESGDWYQIKIDEGVFGWVSKKFSRTENIASDVPLAFSEDGEADAAKADSSAAPAGSLVQITVREGSTLNVRSIPAPEGAVVDMLSRGDTLPLVKESGDWYQLQFEDGSTGWVSKKFSRIQAAASDVPGFFPEVADEKTADAETPVAQVQRTPTTTVVVITVREGSTLNVRSAPSSQGQVLGRLKSGDMRPLLEESGEWYQVEFQDGQSGWVSQKYSAKVNLGSNLVPTP